MSEGTDSALKEFPAARSDHAAVALEIGECYPAMRDPIHWSPTTRAVLLFELDEHQMHSLQLPGGDPTPSIRQADPPKLNPFHAAAISFSDRISRDRLAFRRELEDNRHRARLYQALILGLGAAATALVSFRSMLQKNNALAGTVGVLAILFSATGAAVSSMNSFDGSQATSLRDQRALSQLQQLHWRIASDVMRNTQLCDRPDAPPGEAMDIVTAWRTRLEAIMDSAVESIAKPGDLSEGAPARRDGLKSADMPPSPNIASSQ